jgi:hypothetical protein
MPCLHRPSSARTCHAGPLLLARCHAASFAPAPPSLRAAHAFESALRANTTRSRVPLLPRATCSSAANICARSALPRTRSPCTPAPGATRVRAVRSHTPPRARSRRTCTAPAFTSPYFNATRTAPAPARSRAPPHLLARQGLSVPCAYAQHLHCPRTRPTRSCPASRPPPAPCLSRSCSVHHRAPAREPLRRACLRVLPACRPRAPPSCVLLRPPGPRLARLRRAAAALLTRRSRAPVRRPGLPARHTSAARPTCSRQPRPLPRARPRGAAAAARRPPSEPAASRALLAVEEKTEREREMSCP